MMRKQKHGQTKIVFDKKLATKKVKTEKPKAPKEVADLRTIEINLFWGMIKIKR